jgi:membrane associated rhomboid family serine protease
MFPIRDHNPSQRLPFVTYAVIAANIAVFIIGLAWFQTDRDIAKLYFHYAMIPQRMTLGESYLGLVTSMFLHAGILHLAGNMLFLYIFGDNLEEQLGHLGFLLFYLACGVGAGLAQYASEPYSMVPTVGASGAIAGVMGGYLLFFPRAKVDVLLFFIIFVRIIPVPAWLMLGLWFVLQLAFGAAADAGSGGVAYWAHTGGFVVGFALTLPVLLRRGARAFWASTAGHPPHPEAQYRASMSHIPRVTRRR